MEPEYPNNDQQKQWESANVCPQCGHVVLLKDIGQMERSTGVIMCPICNWSGPVNITIVERNSAE